MIHAARQRGREEDGLHCFCMRIAIVHYWLLNMRGGERVVESLCRMLPAADVFTLFHEPGRVSPIIEARIAGTSFLNPLRRHYRALLPLMPMALEAFDLSDYDLVISSESGPAKGVLTPARTRHICYCHTPMRYLWDLYPQYLHQWAPAWNRALMIPLTNYLRIWDHATASRVDQFVANGENTRDRIRKTYRRDAQVAHPPVAVETFRNEPSEDYFLIVSELVPYKQIDLAVRVCSRLGRRLRIVGDGPQYRLLRKLAGNTVEFCGRVSDDDLRTLYARSRAFLMPGEEDFGIAAVESLASGKPLIALRRGGAVEIAPEGGAVFFDRPDEASLEEAIGRFDESAFVPADLIAHASRFSERAFMLAMQAIIDQPQSSR